jgi:TM2 domain-containing membrane protein YozV
MVNAAQLDELKVKADGMDNNQRSAMHESKKKSLGLALALSIIIPGTGLIYVRKVVKGILVLLFFWTVVVYAYGLYAKWLLE